MSTSTSPPPKADSPPDNPPSSALVPYSFAIAEAGSRDLERRTFLINGRPIVVSQQPRAAKALQPLLPSASSNPSLAFPGERPAHDPSLSPSPATAAAQDKAAGTPGPREGRSSREKDEDLSHVGLVVWQAAFVLGDYLTRVRPLGPWQGLRVLELGAGTGVTGISLAQEGAQVVLTDLPHITPLLRDNVLQNLSVQGTAAVRDLAWGDPGAGKVVEEAFGEEGTQRFHPEVIVGADIMYERQHFPSLIATLKAFCEPRPDTVVYLAFKRRGRGEEDFVAEMEAADFAVSRVVSEALHEEFADGTYQVIRAIYLGPNTEGPMSPTVSTSTSWQTSTFGGTTGGGSAGGGGMKTASLVTAGGSGNVIVSSPLRPRALDLDEPRPHKKSKLGSTAESALEGKGEDEK